MLFDLLWSCKSPRQSAMASAQSRSSVQLVSVLTLCWNYRQELVALFLKEWTCHLMPCEEWWTALHP
jgi:hypothetical protein